jgi:glycosyltransferase involved in cell wall biosynthesis
LVKEQNTLNREMPSRIAVFVRRIGPYHQTRLQELATKAKVLVIETCEYDSTYAWARIRRDAKYAKVTLFPTEEDAKDIDELELAINANLNWFCPELIAVPGWADAAGLLGQLWGTRHGIPIILMSDSKKADARRWFWLELIKRMIVSFADAGFVAGRHSEDYLVDLGLPRERITVGYNVVDNNYFSTEADRARDRAIVHGSKKNAPVFLAVSRFVRRKNLATLIRAHANYTEIEKAAGNEPWRLLIVGEGPERANLSRILHDGVELRSFAQYEELPWLYATAGALILPSEIEQWGLVINEAMAAGCPVIVSEKAGVAQLIEDGVNGHITATDEASLVAALLRMSHCVDRRQLSVAARQCIAQWSPQKFAENFLLAGAVAMPKRRSYVPKFVIKIIARRAISLKSG